jgi:hypothetical protein
MAGVWARCGTDSASIERSVRLGHKAYITGEAAKHVGIVAFRIVARSSLSSCAGAQFFSEPLDVPFAPIASSVRACEIHRRARHDSAKLMSQK